MPGLTSDQIKAIRKATSVTFFHRGSRSYLSAANRTVEPTEYLDIPTRGVLKDFSTRDDGHPAFGQPPYSPCAWDAYHHVSNYDRAWRTVASLLRPGDVIRVQWVRDAHASTMLVRDYPTLHGDRIDVVIERGDNPDRWMHFNLGSVLSPENSSRMIRNVLPANPDDMAAFKQELEAFEKGETHA